ncbi:MAG TPA: type II secretion system protein GspL, partial [Burkholderiaceae bacterium]|nr:type II secretion system protein GspL [Burkholderiaceae bacterium]
PALIAATAALVAVIGLNLHWAQLSRERVELRTRMEATFRQAFPKAQVVVDPLLQMQRQTADLRLRAGQSGPEDFLPLLTRFTQALGPRAADSLASLEYREGRLKARWRAGALDQVNREQLRAACQRAGLRLQFEGDGHALISVAG